MVRIDVDGVDRTDDARPEMRTERRVAYQGVCTVNLFSTDASWRPQRLDTLEVWEPIVLLSDGAIESGDLTFETNEADEDYPLAVGLHVSIAGAGPDGSVLRTVITAVNSPTSVQLEDAASETVTGATARYGVCRFLGIIANVDEQRLGDAPVTREFPGVAGEDLSGVLDSLKPIASRPSESMDARMTALLAAVDADAHGIRLSWPDIEEGIAWDDDGDLMAWDGDDDDAAIRWEARQDSGETLVARDYDGRKSLSTISDEVVAESNASRSWLVDTLGRYRFLLPGTIAAPQALTEDDILGGLTVARPRKDAPRNVQRFYYNAGLTDYVEVSDDASIAALGGRKFYHSAEDETVTTEEEAEARAQALLDEYGAIDRYVIRNLRTLVDRFEPGQTGAITHATHGVSGDHLIQTVVQEYAERDGGYGWWTTLVASSGEVRGREWVDYFYELEL